jgi:N-acetyl-anhydromuramyl-L-alanine amidase AmpD
MRTPLALALALLACGQARAPETETPSSLQAALERAANLEGVPRPLLIALAYAGSRLSMNGGQPSVDGAYGLMHLIDRADAPDALSLGRAARLTGLSAAQLRSDAFANARGGAALLRAEADKLFAQYRDLSPSRLGDWWQAVMRASGNDSAQVADSFAAQVYRILRDGLSVRIEGEIIHLAPQEIDAGAGSIWGQIEQDLSGEYCPNGACVAFVPASSSNYTAGRGGSAVNTIVIHDMEGSYSGSIGWFQNPNAHASAHYCIRSSDGEITQMVHDGDTAWHAGNWDVNVHAVGIEHEGFAHTGSQWYTEAMYRSSAALTRWLTDTFQIPKDRTHIIGHYEVPDPNHPGWFGGSSHHHDPCDAWAGAATWHNVTACYWDWAHYMDLVTGAGATGLLTGFVGDDCCGVAAGSRKPLAGATVLLAGTTYRATTDSSGVYSFTVPPGTYTPQGSMSGYDSADHTSLGAGYAAAVSVAAAQTTWASMVLHASQPGAAPPVVKITSPADGAALAASPAEVKGTVSDASVTRVKINGADTPASGGSFSAAVALTAGANPITVTATNSSGTGSATVHVSYAPPVAGSGVEGHVTGPGGTVAGAGLTLSPGNARAVTGAAGGYHFDAAAGAYTLTVDAGGFQPLSQAVTVPSGKVITVDLTLQPAGTQSPHIRIDSPSEGQLVDAQSITVAGVAEVPDLKSLTVQGEQVAVDAKGAFSVAVTLKQGMNEIVIAAVTSGGQVIEARVKVEFAGAARGGCSSAAPAGWMALLMLGLARRRRWLPCGFLR